MLDDDLRDKLKQEIQQPLAMRLYAKVSSDPDAKHLTNPL